MLQPHHLVPHFEVTDLAGERVHYSSVWQRRHLVLVMLPNGHAPSRDYADRLMALAAYTFGRATRNLNELIFSA
jgi:hypothetical protein